jgi:hypothetical protein
MRRFAGRPPDVAIRQQMSRFVISLGLHSRGTVMGWRDYRNINAPPVMGTLVEISVGKELAL